MKKMLYDHYKLFENVDYPEADEKFEIDGQEYDSDDIILVDGKPYVVEMTLSPKVPDSECMRIKIDGEYYYFG